MGRMGWCDCRLASLFKHSVSKKEEENLVATSQNAFDFGNGNNLSKVHRWFCFLPDEKNRRHFRTWRRDKIADHLEGKKKKKLFTLWISTAAKCNHRIIWSLMCVIRFCPQHTEGENSTSQQMTRQIGKFENPKPQKIVVWFDDGMEEIVMVSTVASLFFLLLSFAVLSSCFVIGWLVPRTTVAAPIAAATAHFLKKHRIGN